MRKYNRYLYLYLGIVFPLAWGIMIACSMFASTLEPYIGKITLTHPLIIFILYLPSIAGLLTYYVWGGKPAIANLFAKLLPRKQDLFWFPVLFMIFTMFALVMHYGSLLLGIKTPTITATPFQIVLKALWNFIEEIGLLGGIFGWVGFLLPYWQGRLRSNVKAGLVTGLIFGLWVLPGYGIASVSATTSYLLYVLQLMSFMVFASYIFNATEGNLSFYLFAFWLAATGSHIQLYYFNLPVQIMEVSFFIIAIVLIDSIFKHQSVKYPLQKFPDYVQTKNSPRSMPIIADEIKSPKDAYRTAIYSRSSGR